MPIFQSIFSVCGYFRMDGGELFGYVSEHENFPETQAIHYLREALKGVVHMHSKDLMHLDLKVRTMATLFNLCLWF